MNSAAPLFEFDHVSVRFNGDLVINNVSFKVFNKEKFLIYGKSGIGKTTFFRLLLGFETTQHGRIYFKGEPINAHSIWTIRRHIAYVSQDPDIGSGPVHTMIQSFFSFSHTRSLADNKQRLMELLDFMRLPHKILKEDYEQLSGGEKQRIMMIIALLLQRDIFFLDEVTSSLDRELKLKIIRYFIKNPDWTVLSISHDRDWLRRKELTVFKARS